MVSDTEFRAKDGSPQISVYYLAGAEYLVQACAEHAASSALDPKSTMNADLEGLRPPPIVVAGTGQFGFTKAAHRNMTFPSREELISTVKTLLAERATRLHPVKREELGAYVRARRDAQDPEWVGFLATCPKTSWKKLLA